MTKSPLDFPHHVLQAAFSFLLYNQIVSILNKNSHYNRKVIVTNMDNYSATYNMKW